MRRRKDKRFMWPTAVETLASSEAVLSLDELSKSGLSLFVAEKGDSPGPLLSDVDEQPLVDWALAASDRQSLVKEHLDTTGRVYTGVQQPVVPPGHKPGDVDAMFVPSHIPETMAVEFKRLKIVVRPDYTKDKFSWRDKLRKGVEQATGLRALGFHRVYLGLLLAVDARDGDAMNVFTKGPRAATRNKVLRDELDDLHPDIGVLLVDVRLAASGPNRISYTFGVHVLHAAAPQGQPPSLSDAIEKYMQHHAPLGR